MDVARRRDAAEIQQWWTTAPQLDENALRDGILQLINQIHAAASDDDWDHFQEYVRLYELGESTCKAEPQLSAYEYGQMGIGVMQTDNLLSRGDFPKAAYQIQKVHETYLKRMQRYAEQGVPPRRASEARYRNLYNLAFLKWTGPEEWRDFIFSPDELVAQIQETYDHIIGFVAANPGSHTNERSLREGLALCELMGLKTALRYIPSKVPELLSTFNQHHNDHLVTSLRHYKLVNAAEGDKSAYYWDFELAKLRMSPDAPAQDIYMCIELRSITARNTFGDWKIQGLLRSWRREALIIVREIKSRQEQA
jgi:hypothetical protein